MDGHCCKLEQSVWNTKTKQCESASVPQVPSDPVRVCLDTPNNGEACETAADLAIAKHNFGDAVRLHDRACELKVARSCDVLARLFREGTGVEKDDTAADNYSHRACELGIAAACTNVGIRYQSSGDWTNASKRFEKACSSDDFYACGFLGKLYGEGRGVAKDAARAQLLFEKACNGEQRDSCVDYALGLIPKEVHERAKRSLNPLLCVDSRSSAVEEKMCARATDLLERHCAERIGRACSGAARVAPNVATSVSFHESACALGEVASCVDAGNILARGDGIERDMARADKSKAMACDLGDMTACKWHNEFPELRVPLFLVKHRAINMVVSWLPIPWADRNVEFRLGMDFFFPPFLNAGLDWVIDPRGPWENGIAAHFGINLFSYPRVDRSRFSPLNITVGAAGQIQWWNGPEQGAYVPYVTFGPYIRNVFWALCNIAFESSVVVPLVNRAQFPLQVSIGFVFGRRTSSGMVNDGCHDAEVERDLGR